jgi:hypothetical protein
MPVPLSTAPVSYETHGVSSDRDAA